MTERYPLRPITPDEFDAYCEVPIQAFNDSDQSAEHNEHERLVFEFDRSIAAFDGDAIVGTTAAYSFQLTVPGGITGAAGVTFVAVLPSHRRRGILSAMMRHQLADIAARGEAVAALYASETGIYGRYGYGCASWQLSLKIRRGEGTLSPVVTGRTASGSAGTGAPGAATGRAAGRAARRAGQGLRRGRSAPARDDGQGRTLVAIRPRRPRVAAAGHERAEVPAGGRRRGPARLCPVPDEARLGR